MDSPKISVIVPVFKTAKYLRKCIESILEQTFQDFELLLITEGVEEDDRICSEYVKKDSRVFLYTNPKKGLGCARNRGLELARGEYISFIDSDDYVEATFLEKMKTGIEQGADIVQCGTNVVYEGEACLKIKKRDEDYFLIDRTGMIFLDNNLFGVINVGCWNKLYRKNLITKYSLRFPEYKRNEDAYFVWAYWAISESMYCIPEKLYCYLRRKDSLMAKTFAKELEESVLDHLDIAEEFYEFLKWNGLLEKRQDAFFRAYIISYFFVKDNATLLFWEIGHQKAREFLSQIFVPDEYVLLKRIVKYKFSDFSLNGKNTFLENVLSLKESYNQKHKILTFCGVKFKLKNN